VLALGLMRPADLRGLRTDPPVFAGFAQLPALAEQVCGGVTQPLPLPEARAVPQRFEAIDAVGEVEAAADWCRAQLAESPEKRLLVIDRGSGLPLSQVGALLWDRLVEGSRASLGEPPEAGLLGIEGGQRLMEQGLFDDALATLSLAQDPIAFETLSQLLRSAHLSLLPPAAALRLEQALARASRQHATLAEWLGALDRIAERVPGAREVGARLGQVLAPLRIRQTASATLWAARFDTALRSLGFPGQGGLDSRQAQRLARWNELLDELATLDAVAPALRVGEALTQLVQLARHGRHEAASGDAAITLAEEGGDPVADYDGIWVLGLTGTRWPEPPRPDPFIPLAAQRQAGWSEASVALRMQAARFELQAWRARTSTLVLSHGRYAGDVHQLPSPLIEDVEPRPAPPIPGALAVATLTAMDDARLTALAPFAAVVVLPRGVRSIELQQACAFRAQGELRLGARPLNLPIEGIDARLRGDLLHAALQELWASIGDSEALSRLDETARVALCERAWQRATPAVLAREVLLPPARSLARERARGVALLMGLLAVESERDPFRVQHREQPRTLDLGGPTLRLRIDRIDTFADGSRRVIDYKTGSNARAQFFDELPEPVQLAVYATALHAAGEAPQALALLSVSARRLRFSGGGQQGTAAAMGLIEVPMWERRFEAWQRIIEALAAAHVAGVADIAPLQGACTYCHLQGFCRIGIATANHADDAAGDEAQGSER
jgi:probable DNA repair protein